MNSLTKPQSKHATKISKTLFLHLLMLKMIKTKPLAQKKKMRLAAMLMAAMLLLSALLTSRRSLAKIPFSREPEQGFQLVAVADAKKHTATFLDDAEAAFAAGGESDAAEDSDDSEEDYVKALSTKNLTTLKKKLEDAEEELDVVLEDIAADKGGKFILVAMKKEIDALEDDDPEKERLTNKLHHITSTFITFKNMFKGTNYDPNVFREVAMVFQAEHANVSNFRTSASNSRANSNLEDAIEAKEKEHEEARKKKKEARREVKRKQRKDQRKRSGDFPSSPFDTRSEKKAKLLK